MPSKPGVCSFLHPSCSLSRCSVVPVPGYPAHAYSTVTDDHLAERVGLFVVPVGGLGVVKRKHPIDDRLEPVLGDSAAHGEKLGATASGNAP